MRIMSHPLRKAPNSASESGVTTVADISNTGHAFSVLKKSPHARSVYKEIIGLKPEQAADIMKKLKRKSLRLKRMSY